LFGVRYQLFDNKSDVWSYGALLSEICTMGAVPFPTLQPE